MSKREMKKLSDGISVEAAEIVALLRDGVLRRDLLEGDDADAAFTKIARHFRQQAKKPAQKKVSPAAPPTSPVQTLSDQILAESEASSSALAGESGVKNGPSVDPLS